MCGIAKVGQDWQTPHIRLRNWRAVDSKNDTAIDLIDRLAVYKAQHVPFSIRRSVQLAWTDRWASMLGLAVQDAIAASLLAHSGEQLVLDPSAAPIPELDSVFDGQRWALEPSDPISD